MHTSRRGLAGLACLTLALCATYGVARAEESPELLLTWNAPYGHNGATDGITRACGDTAAADTLYLSYRLQEDHGVFSGILGTLMFHPQFSDTLSDQWATADFNPDFLTVEFPSDTADAFRAGWKATGVGGYRFFANPTQGMLRLIFAVPATAAQPIAAGTYSFARVIVKRPPEAERCDQGMCVEFRAAKFSFSINAPSVMGDLNRDGFVTANSHTGLACSKYRRLAESRELEAKARREAAEATRRGGSGAEIPSAPDSTHH